MFENLAPLSGDPLLTLIGLYRDDRRSNKIDLGVGVYRDEHGRTPVMRAVKAAEQRLVEDQQSKSYVGPEGDGAFVEGFADLILGSRRLYAGIQTPGGTAALYLAARLLATNCNRRIWVGTPTWPNHLAVFADVGLEVRTYEYFDPSAQSLCFDKLVEALKAAETGDAVLLHGCCHNPSGADLSLEQWREVAELLANRGLIPLIDVAYLGFGNSLKEDGTGFRTVLDAVPALVAASCSKSFGLYRDRTGALFVTCNAETNSTVLSHFVTYARSIYSMPPAHGAEVVSTILNDVGLRADWQAELAEASARVRSLRALLAEGFKAWKRSSALTEQKGMFSLLPLTRQEVLALRCQAAIYLPENGRINIAGLSMDKVDAVIEAINPLFGWYL
ncbi:aromatic amino acid transaminase [Roseibium sediminicola]|uniref:Aromatic amino acid transaminase n=1 Tax=Roseibium sediminicola TaxID=2933272 RepID=A0ABT0H2P1_9HYPH|nr:aromatic amino acid transaminase [Roseibium sp. CAU 1639]MCK7615953.1 aromatic amino acid transaminase [Roseibium sp. CAU 1639]